MSEANWTTPIVQAMPDEELTAIVQRLLDGAPRTEIEAAALRELSLRKSRS